jgi:cobalamin biosynthesis protein CobW
MHKIPVTVITGFLGSGKTTAIRHLLQNNHGRRIAVLVNEFGEVGIDGELLESCQICDDEEDADSNILELTNGCLCCTVQEEFFPTMQELLKRRDRIDNIVVETSGLALPKPLVKAFRWPEIRNSATVDGVISVVDCDALASGQLVGDLDALEAQRQADPNLEHETPIEELFEDQLACADSILLTKTDLVDGETLAKVKNWLTQEVSDGVKIIECDRGRVNPDVLLGFNAAVEEDLDNRPSHHDSEDDHEHDDDINSVYLSFDRGFDPAELVQQLSEVVKQHEIYRIKGFVAVPDKKMRLVLQGVGKRFDHFYDRPWKSNEPRQTRIVLIGRQLNRDAIASAMSQPLSAVG